MPDPTIFSIGKSADVTILKYYIKCVLVHLFSDCMTDLKGFSKLWNCSTKLINFFSVLLYLWVMICLPSYICCLQIFFVPWSVWLASKISWSCFLLYCSWKTFKRHMLNMRSHSDAKGIELKRPNDSIYTFPCPDCMCRGNRSEVLRVSPWYFWKERLCIHFLSCHFCNIIVRFSIGQFFLLSLILSYPVGGSVPWAF